ncbi:hypothetical protein VNI00_016097 [Paramarasmius palmivorus]|uniref:MYND-type domain-containing protein n=1 Tax=Paramarasmius palmivorus TaxID=297713 RepID=A0AAW0BGS0_9AGAR
MSGPLGAMNRLVNILSNTPIPNYFAPNTRLREQKIRAVTEAITSASSWITAAPLGQQLLWRQGSHRLWPHVHPWLTWFIRAFFLAKRGNGIVVVPLSSQQLAVLGVVLGAMGIARPHYGQQHDLLGVAPRFVDAAVELCLKLALLENQHSEILGFTEVWLAFARLIVSPKSVESIRTAIKSLGDRYNAVAIVLQRVQSECRGDIEVSHSSTVSIGYFLSFSSTFLSDESGFPRELYAGNAITLLASTMLKIAGALHAMSPDDVAPAIQCLVSCGNVLHHSFCDSYKWVQQAVKGKLIPAIAFFVTFPNHRLADSMNSDLVRVYVAILTTVKAYLYIRSIRNIVGSSIHETRVLWKKLPRDHPLRTAFKNLYQDAVKFKQLMGEFWTSADYWLCNRGTQCPRASRITKEDVDWRACSSCDVVMYCSKKCQIIDWKSVHRETCKRLQPVTLGHRSFLLQSDQLFIKFLSIRVIEESWYDIEQHAQQGKAILVDFCSDVLSPTWSGIEMPSQVTVPLKEGEVRVKVHVPGSAGSYIYDCTAVAATKTEPLVDTVELATVELV